MIKRVYNFTIASLKMTFRNRFALFMSFMFPVAIILAFGFFNNSNAPKLNIAVITGNSKSISNVKNTSVSVVENNIIKELKKSGNVKVSKVSSLSDGESQIKNNNIDLLMYVTQVSSIQPILPKCRVGYACPQFIGVSKIPHYKISFYANKFSSNIAYAELFISSFKYNVLKSTLTSTNVSIPFSYSQTLLTSGKEENSYIDFLIPGVLALSLMQGIIFAVINIIVNYKELGVLRRLSVTPLTKSDFIASLTLTRLIFGLIQIAILIVIAAVFLNVLPVGGTIGFVNLSVVIILGSLMFVTLGLIISTISNKTATVFPIANLITLPMLFLSGVFFSVSDLPSWLQNIVNLFPLTFLANALRGIYDHGYSLLTIHNDIIGMAVWVVIFFILNVIFFKWE
jgi:ABC-2 type transport system permease protein